MHKDILDVYYADQGLIGQLQQLPEGSLSFKYDEKWVAEKAAPISVTLPVRPDAYTHEECWPFFHSLVMEQPMRSRITTLQKLAADDDYGFLKAYGGECAGALLFRPNGQQQAQHSQYKELTDKQLQAWIEQPHQHPPLLASTDEGMRISLGGVQEKLTLFIDNDDRYFLPVNGAPTSHIIKPQNPAIRENIVLNEAISQHFMKHLSGREVAETDIWKSCLRSRRYDRRKKNDGTIQRLHQEDMCSVLGLGSNNKYEKTSRNQRLYKDLFEVIRTLSDRGYIADTIKQQNTLLDWAIGNVLICNSDAHTKNISLLHDGQGTVRIAPFYDTVSIVGLTFINKEKVDSKLAISINGETNPFNVTKKRWGRFSEEIGLSRRAVFSRLESLSDNAVPALEAAISTFKVSSKDEKMVNRIRKTIAIQSNMIQTSLLTKKPSTRTKPN